MEFFKGISQRLQDFVHDHRLTHTYHSKFYLFIPAKSTFAHARKPAVATPKPFVYTGKIIVASSFVAYISCAKKRSPFNLKYFLTSYFLLLRIFISSYLDCAPAWRECNLARSQVRAVEKMLVFI